MLTAGPTRAAPSQASRRSTVSATALNWLSDLRKLRVPDKLVQPAPILDKPRLLPRHQLIPGMIEIDRDLADYARGPGAQHHHTLAQVDCLLDIVRNEKDGLTESGANRQ